MKAIVVISVSPGLSVNTYLQKFTEINICISKIVISKGNWFFIPLKKETIRPTDKHKKIMPIISERPATAWLKKPIFFNANSFVKTNSCIE